MPFSLVGQDLCPAADASFELFGVRVELRFIIGFESFLSLRFDASVNQICRWSDDTHQSSNQWPFQTRIAAFGSQIDSAH